MGVNGRGRPSLQEFFKAYPGGISGLAESLQVDRNQIYRISRGLDVRLSFFLRVRDCLRLNHPEGDAVSMEWLVEGWFGAKSDGRRVKTRRA